MPILDNNPTFTYCSWKGMMITYNKIMYPIQNGYSNNKYLYWESNTPYQLIETNVRKPLIADRFLIFINDKGIHTLVPNGDDIVISFDGDNPDLISNKIYGIYEKTEEFDNKFITVETDINGIKQIVGDSSSQEGTLVDRVSKIEQKSNEIDLSVKEVTKEFNDNREMLELRETINKSIIELNSALGIFSSKMNDYYKDNKVSDEEKIEIETQISILDNEKSKVFLEVDKVIRLMESQSQSDKVNNLTSAKGQLDTAISNLKTVISIAISDNTFVPSEITLITDSFGKCNTKINLLKDTINDCIFLGAGGKITEELARIGIKSNEIVLSVKEVEENLKSDASIIKSELEGQIKDVNTALGNFEETVNGAFKDGLIDETEKAILNEKLKVLDKEKTDIDVKYESFFNDKNLTDPEKINMTTTYNEYVTKHEELKNKINHVISDDMVNDAEKLQVDTLFTEYSTKLANINDAMNKAIDKIALNKANKEIEDAKDKLQGQINEVNDKISDLDHVIDGTFEDNLIDEAERKSIEQNLNTLNTEKTDIDNQYATLYNNKFLDGQLKIDYKTSYDNYVSKHNALVNLINGILAKTELINNTDRQNMTNAYNELNESLASFVTISNRVIDYIATNKSESVKSDLETQISEVNGKVDGIVGDLEGAIKDGIIDEAESVILLNSLNELNKEKADVDKRYEYIYNDVDLIGSSKTNLLNAKTDFDLKINTLIETINTITSDNTVTEEEKLLFDNAVTDYNISSSNLSVAFDEAINSIAIKKNSDLKSQLSKEISDLNTALGTLENTMNETFKDGILSDAEKLAIKQNLQTLSNEKADIDKQYETIYSNENLLGDAKTNLKTSYDDYILKYNTLVTTINDILEKVGLIDSTDQSKLDNAFKSHTTALGSYSQRVNEAIDSIAKKVADDTANKVDKKYSEILLTPDGIVNKVGKLETVTDNQGNRLSSAESKIVQLSDKITNTVTVDDVKSVIEQSPTEIKYGFNNISDNVTISSSGLTVNQGAVACHTITTPSGMDPIIKLFPQSDGEHCSIDATKQYETGGRGSAIRLKWNKSNYVYVGEGNIAMHYGSGKKFSFYSTNSSDVIKANNGELSFASDGLIYQGQYLAEKGHIHNIWWNDIQGKPTSFPVSWSSVSNKPSTFPPQSHSHSEYYAYGYDVVFNTIYPKWHADLNQLIGSTGKAWGYVCCYSLRYNNYGTNVSRTSNLNVTDFFKNYTNLSNPINAKNKSIEIIGEDRAVRYNDVFLLNDNGESYIDGEKMSYYQSKCLEELINEDESNKVRIANLENEVKELKNMLLTLINK